MRHNGSAACSEQFDSAFPEFPIPRHLLADEHVQRWLARRIDWRKYRPEPQGEQFFVYTIDLGTK